MQPTPLDDRLPPDPRLFGLRLFLASLGVLFASSMLAYIVIRSMARQRGLETGSLRMPASLWFSTALMLASTFLAHWALRCVRAGRRQAFRMTLVAALVAALGFLVVQTPSLLTLLDRHHADRAQNVHLYGLVVLLIALHALHVVGGLVPMVIVTRKALAGAYHAGRHEGPRYVVIYWHFLDVVWLAMFGVFLLAG